MERQEQFRRAVAVCACMLVWVHAAPARLIYVDDDASPIPSDGASWAEAYRYLQDALLAAAPGDEIRVAQGIYRPDEGVTVAQTARRRGADDDRTAPEGWPFAFALQNGVAIRGGFAGPPPQEGGTSPHQAGSGGVWDPNARDPEWHETVLSGDLDGNDEPLWGLGSPLYDHLRRDNSPVLVISKATDPTAVLDGFVIESARGVGMHNSEGSPRVENCLFRSCAGVSMGGGALLCEGGEPTLVNCTFERNTSSGPGGAVNATNARLRLLDCLFRGNWTEGQGGAVYCADTHLTLDNCSFDRNSASSGGAVHQIAGVLTMIGCLFEGNGARQGGAVAVAAETVSVEHCTFRRNWATHQAGAIEIASPSLLLGCRFVANSSPYGGAVHTVSPSTPTVDAEATEMVQCVFSGNRADEGGGALFVDDALTLVRNCTLAGNSAGQCHALAWSSGPYRITLRNCIVWDGTGALARFWPSMRSRVGARPDETEVTVTYSDVQGGWPGEGNIDTDPLFAAPGWWADPADLSTPVEPGFADAVWVEGDYHLRSEAGRWDPVLQVWVEDEITSPCVDAGDPEMPFDEEPEPNGSRINMGAYGGTAGASKSPW